MSDGSDETEREGCAFENCIAHGKGPRLFEGAACPSLATDASYKDRTIPSQACSYDHFLVLLAKLTADKMVIASLTFLKPLPLYDTEKPYFLVMPGSVDSSAFRKTNLEYSTKEGVTIEDVRDRGLSSFDLEEDGFQFLNYEPKTLLGKDNENIETYCQEITELVSREYNAAHAVCYDYRVGYLVPTSKLRQHRSLSNPLI